MPNRKQAAAALAAQESEPLLSLAYALFRVAAECCRQHRRHAALVELDVSEAEEKAAERIVGLTDELLTEAATTYEKGVATAGVTDEEWRARANALWHAAREYERRHQASEHASKQLQSHDLRKLLSITLEFEIEASSLLQLQHAVDAYRRVRPEAALGAGRG